MKKNFLNLKRQKNQQYDIKLKKNESNFITWPRLIYDMPAASHRLSIQLPDTRFETVFCR